jgi:hypothetical protein
MDGLKLRFERGLEGCAEVLHEELRRVHEAEQAQIDARRRDGYPVERTVPERKLPPNPVPLWQRILGLTAEREWSLSPDSRRQALMRLARGVEQMVRAELRKLREVLAAEEERIDAAQLRQVAEEARVMEALGGRAVTRPAHVAARLAEELEPRDTRRWSWSPGPELCFYLQIAPSKLSRLLQQATGLNLNELVDCVRCEDVERWLRKQYREAARVWRAAEQSGCGASTAGGAKGSPVVRGARLAPLWVRARELLRWARQRWNGFKDRLACAVELGIGTRQRLLRSAVACHGVALETLELEAAQDALQELERAEQSGGGGSATAGGASGAGGVSTASGAQEDQEEGGGAAPGAGLDAVGGGEVERGAAV